MRQFEDQVMAMGGRLLMIAVFQAENGGREGYFIRGEDDLVKTAPPDLDIPDPATHWDLEDT
ncbi:MAG: hypothetical protein AAFV69_08680 [Pseudomonadota bacterium]